MSCGVGLVVHSCEGAQLWWGGVGIWDLGFWIHTWCKD